MRSLTLFAAIACVITVATACDESTGDVSLPRYRGEPNGDNAALVGTLAIDARNCLVVRTTDSSETLIAVAATVGSWRDDSRILVISGRELAVGEEVVFGGSAIPVSRAASDIRWSTPPTTACLRDRSFIWLAGDRPIRSPGPGIPPSPLPTPSRSLTHREALEKDARTYAEQHGVLLAEAIAILEAQTGLASTPTASGRP